MKKIDFFLISIFMIVAFLKSAHAQGLEALSQHPPKHHLSLLRPSPLTSSLSPSFIKIADALNHPLIFTA